MHNCVVSKIRVYDPKAKTATASANREYCKYIATRPGVDLNPLSEDKITAGLPDEKYLTYITERPRSHGLFGNINTEELNDISNTICSVSKSGKNIYRGIVSLTEEDARELGYFDKDKWVSLLNRTMPDIANVFGVHIQNLQWVAAFHLEKGHPHVHYMMWDTSDRVASSFIHVSKQHTCRELFSKEIFRDERRQHVIDKTISRDNIIDLTKQAVQDSLKDLNRIFDEAYKEKIPDKIYGEEIDLISSKVLELSVSLPDKGKINYAYMTPEIKVKVDDITNLILKRADIGRELKNYLDNMEQISDSYSNTDGKKETVKSRAYKDISKRIGNIVLKSADCIRKQHDNITDILAKTEINNQIDELLNTSISDEPSNDFDDIRSDFIKYQEAHFFDNSFNAKNTRNNSNQYNSSKSDINSLLWSYDYKIAKTIIYNKNRTEKEFNKAVSLLFKEVNNGNPLAMCDIASLYKSGMIYQAYERNTTLINDDLDYSNYYYKLAFDKFNDLNQKYNSGYLQYRIANMYLRGQGTSKDVHIAAEWIKKSIDNHCSLGHYTYANMFKTGKGVEKDMKKAFTHYESAANNENLKNYYAMYEMGIMYMKGEGTEKNIDLANTYFEEALKGFRSLDKSSRDEKINYRIGMMYLNGMGTEKNIEKAIEYLKEAANLNNVFAQYQLYMIYSNANSDSNKNLAIEYLKKAADNGYSMAQYNLGKILINVNSKYYDYDKGIEYLKKSVEQDNSNARYALGKEYINPNSSMYDPLRGISLLEKEVSKNNNFAMFTLAKFYLDEKSPFYNEKLGMEYLFKAANMNNSYAQLYLGKLYHYGKHVDKNETMSDFWTSKSSDNGCDAAKEFKEAKDNSRLNYSRSQAYRIIVSSFNAISKSNHDYERNLNHKNVRKHHLGIDKFNGKEKNT